MGDVLQFVDSIASAPAVRLDLNAGPWGLVIEGTDFSPPRKRHAWAATLVADGAHLAASAYDNRTLRLQLDLMTSTVDANLAALGALHRELERPGGNIVRWQPHGASAPVFFRTLEAAENRVTEHPGAGTLRTVVVEVQAEPFGLGLREDLGVFTVYNDPAEGATLNANADFEATAAPWTALGGAVARSTAQAWQGSASLLVTPSGSAATVEARTELVPVVAGVTYRGSAWTRSAAARQVGVAINWYDSTSTYLGMAVTNASLSAGAWTWLDVVGTAPAGAASARLLAGYMTGTPAAGHLVWVDDARIRRSGDNTAQCLDLPPIRGDVETPLILTMPVADVRQVSNQTSTIAMRRRGNPAAMPIVLQCESMAARSGDTSVNNSLAGASGGAGMVTTFGSIATEVARVGVQQWPTGASPDIRGRYRVWARVRQTADNTAIEMRMRWGIANGLSAPLSGDYVRPITTTQWQMVDLGLVSIPAGVDPVTTYGGQNLAARGQRIDVAARRVSGSGGLEWDYLAFAPADDQLAIIRWGELQVPGDPVGEQVVVDAALDQVYGLASDGVVLGGSAPSAVQGGLPYASPGTNNRVYLLRNVGTGDTITGATRVSVSYHPRYLYARPVAS